jgi:hypothetical protein
MVADLNHGNSENYTANSSSSSKSQKQCLDTLVTSAAKVAMPGILNLPNMGFNDGLRLTNLHILKPDIHCQVYRGSQPEFRFAIRVRNVDMDAGLLAREEKPSELAVTNDCWRHLYTMPRWCLSSVASAVGTPVTRRPGAIPDVQFSRIRFLGCTHLSSGPSQLPATRPSCYALQ